MRPANNSVVAYAPGQVPADPKDIPRFLQDELQKIASAINSLAEQGAFTTVAPARPRNGMIRLSDGVGWDPLTAGAPRYVGYYSAAWKLLG